MLEYTSFFRDENFLSLLVSIDQAAALKYQQTNTCSHCNAPLHSACYERSFRLPGVAVEGVPDIGLCFSLCCSNRECRRRQRVISVRFARRSPNFLGIVALVDLLNAPNSERRMSDAAKALGLSASTLRRWVRFWRGTVNSKWWRKTLVLRPSLRFPHNLLPDNCEWNKLLSWLRSIAELFMDMSSMMAHSYRPQKTTGAGSRA